MITTILLVGGVLWGTFLAKVIMDGIVNYTWKMKEKEDRKRNEFKQLH